MSAKIKLLSLFNGRLDGKAMLIKFLEEQGDNIDEVVLIARPKQQDGEALVYSNNTAPWFLHGASGILADYANKSLNGLIEEE